MRLQTAQNPRSAAEILEFADFLLKVGEGSHEPFSELGCAFVKVPHDLVVQPTHQNNKPVLSFNGWLYSEIQTRFVEPDYFTERMILAPVSAAAQEINNSHTEAPTGYA
jgi:hypothetical protein